MNTLRKISETKTREWLIEKIVSEKYIISENLKGRKKTTIENLWCNMMESKMINSINKL